MQLSGVRPSVSLSVQFAGRVCCSAPGGQEILICCGGAAAARRANAGSATLSAGVEAEHRMASAGGRYWCGNIKPVQELARKRSSQSWLRFLWLVSGKSLKLLPPDVIF